jgi:hypothetical protein
MDPAQNDYHRNRPPQEPGFLDKKNHGLLPPRAVENAARVFCADSM